MDERLVIRGGKPLRGSLVASGSKNAALYAIAAALLTADPVTLRNAPAIADVGEMLDLLTALGATVDGSDEDEIHIQVPEITTHRAPDKHVVATRASFLVMGPLLGRDGEASCAPPGGDVIGVRPLDVHLEGFRALGADVSRDGAAWVAKSPKLTGARIFSDYPSVLGTVNLIFAAALADGETTLVNAAAEPEVQMICEMLISMGALISGHGSNTITIEGVESLVPVEHSVVPDRIEAATYLAALGVAGGELTLVGARADHMEMLVQKLGQMGMSVTPNDEGLIAIAPRRLTSVDVATLPYPGVASDYKPFIVSLLALSDGVGIVTENIFGGRFGYIDELRRMGADIRTEGHHAVVRGKSQLSGAPVKAIDIRAGASLVVAALGAVGETVVSNIDHIDRGYDDLVGKLAAVGANISRSVLS